MAKIAEIEVSVRFREDLGRISDLARSIHSIGLIHPITIIRQKSSSLPYGLLAGRRRLEAAKLLGWVNIPALIYQAEGMIDGD